MFKSVLVPQGPGGSYFCTGQVGPPHPTVIHTLDLLGVLASKGSYTCPMGFNVLVLLYVVLSKKTVWTLNTS